jgi:hypothetical protein
MVTIDQVDSEVVVEPEEASTGDVAGMPLELRIEEIRDVVREILRDELDRHLRTETRA